MNLEIRELEKAVWQELKSKGVEPARKRSPLNACLFNREKDCTIPDFLFKYCSNCPYSYAYSLSLITRNLFRKIVGFAIVLLNQNISLGKPSPPSP